MTKIIDFPDRKSQQHIVLLVDDEFLMRGVLREILNECGFYVVTANSGDEAIKYLQKMVHVDVVFSDLKMPGVDGLELAKWMAQNKPDLPIILANSFASKTKIAHQLCGAHSIEKPFDFDCIVTKIREVAAHKRKLHS